MYPRMSGRVRLADQVVEMLSTEIREGRLTEGDKLPTEVQLGKQLGVSRTVVREAISSLRSSGLVEPRQGLGVFVTKPSSHQLSFSLEASLAREKVLQIGEVRAALETEAASLAAARSTPEGIEGILGAAARLDDAVAAGELGVDEDMDFHFSIARATGNPFLLETLEYLSRYIIPGMRITRANEAQREHLARRVRAEHHAIIEAIAAGSPSAARTAARSHMSHTSKRLSASSNEFWNELGGIDRDVTTGVLAPLHETQSHR